MKREHKKNEIISGKRVATNIASKNPAKKKGQNRVKLHQNRIINEPIWQQNKIPQGQKRYYASIWCHKTLILFKINRPLSAY